MGGYFLSLPNNSSKVVSDLLLRRSNEVLSGKLSAAAAPLAVSHHGDKKASVQLHIPSTLYILVHAVKLHDSRVSVSLTVT